MPPVHAGRFQRIHDGGTNRGRGQRAAGVAVLTTFSLLTYTATVEKENLLCTAVRDRRNARIAGRSPVRGAMRGAIMAAAPATQLSYLQLASRSHNRDDACSRQGHIISWCYCPCRQGHILDVAPPNSAELNSRVADDTLSETVQRPPPPPPGLREAGCVVGPEAACWH